MPSQVAAENSTCSALISSWLPRPPSGGGGKFHLPRAKPLLAAEATFGWRRRIPLPTPGCPTEGSAGLLVGRQGLSRTGRIFILSKGPLQLEIRCVKERPN